MQNESSGVRRWAVGGEGRQKRKKKKRPLGEASCRRDWRCATCIVCLTWSPFITSSSFFRTSLSSEVMSSAAATARLESSSGSEEIAMGGSVNCGLDFLDCFFGFFPWTGGRRLTPGEEEDGRVLLPPRRFSDPTGDAGTACGKSRPFGG